MKVTDTVVMGKRRNIQGWGKYIISIIAIILACFQLYTAFFGQLASMDQRTMHYALVLPLIFLLYPGYKKSPSSKSSLLDWILAGLSFVCTFYMFLMYDDLADRAGVYEDYELWFGIILVILVFEAGRRTLGYILPGFCALFLLFAYFGEYMPGILQHPGLSIPRIIEELYMTTDGLFGMVAGVSATYIYLFILFGAFLSSTGTSTFFNNFAMALSGHRRGGPAKIAVLSSALMGTINGSTSANVATTGAFTIPLMKRIGYKNYFAGAVEAAASSGGQIMPPVMGAAAFIIADTLGISYTKVILAATIPGVLYFVGIWCCLTLQANKLDLKGLPKDELPRLKEVIVQTGYKALPLVIIVALLVMGYNPLFAGCMGILSSILLSFVRKTERLTWRTFFSTLENGSKSALSVAMACLIVGVVIGVMGATGAALRIGDAILSITHGAMFPTLVVTMFITLLLGMGMPTTASYIMASAVATPALIILHCDPLSAHFFVFYYACLSTITPPVCVGAYTAAGLAGASPNKTAFTAVTLALSGFIIPFIFIYSPELLINEGADWMSVILALLTALFGVFMLSVATIGYAYSTINPLMRLLSFASALLLIFPGVITDATGIVLAVCVLFWSKYSTRMNTK